jgi:hypothetical protein
MGNSEGYRASLWHGNHHVRGESLRPDRGRPVLGDRTLIAKCGSVRCRLRAGDKADRPLPDPKQKSKPLRNRTSARAEADTRLSRGWLVFTCPQDRLSGDWRGVILLNS